MSIYLVQHGKCEPQEINPDRPLTDEGKLEVQRIAGVAGVYNVQVRHIVHSGKTRARETAEIFRMNLPTVQDVSEMEGMGPNDDVDKIAGAIKDREGLMLVGHLPFMGRLASLLVTGSPDIPVFQLQNGGILCLEKNSDTGRWIITWALMPNVK